MAFLFKHMKKTALSATRRLDYGQWYQDVISAAELAEHSMTRGCMILKPWGYALWERCQKVLDFKLKDTDHQNVYFPLLIPLSCFQKEASHIEGFAKECAVVTHHRLKANAAGQLVPDGLLEEPYVIRPTSEMIIGEAFSRWIESYRDLPILINQWANVMRWEMRTRLFLRTAEILWQEGHTAHATKTEAMDETLKILYLYEDFMKEILAIPVITGSKPVVERFPGAMETYTLEAMTQNGKALQAGTSHFMGQNFARACDITFLNKAGSQEHAWTTSWGVTTRLIGALIMSHADDNGLVLPANLAPYHVVILPMIKGQETDQSLLEYCERLKTELQSLQYEGEAIRVHIDRRDKRGGEKNWSWIKKGVPIRLEIGAREVDGDQVCMSIRQKDADPTVKTTILRETFVSSVQTILQTQHQTLWDTALAERTQQTQFVDSEAMLKAICLKFKADEEEQSPGFLECYLADSPEIGDRLKLYGLTPRCMPLKRAETGTCILTGQLNAPLMLVAKAY